MRTTCRLIRHPLPRGTLGVFARSVETGEEYFILPEGAETPSNIEDLGVGQELSAVAQRDLVAALLTEGCL